MVDLQTVCCMCGDVGFPDKIFRCIKCHHRFQHSYCSNYYRESSQIEICDWCQSEERTTPRHGGSSAEKLAAAGGIPEYSGGKVKKHDRAEESGEKAKSPSGAPSPRQTTRRYKLLKDVMC